MIDSIPILPVVKDIICELFLSGQSINHIIYLLDYKYCIDDVLEAVRERLATALKPGDGRILL